MNRLAIFDCDGTLVDSQSNICVAMAEAFAAAGLTPPERSQIRAVVGLSLVEAMAAMLPEAGAKLHLALAEQYKSAFQRLRANGLVAEPLYQGMAELIDALARDGWRLGIATGKSDRGLSLCLGSHGLADRFATLQSADRHPSKPHPSMIEAALADTGAEARETTMIGDTSYDMMMAKAAGVRAIGVAWGYHSRETLVAAGADHVAESPEDLFSELARSLE